MTQQTIECLELESLQKQHEEKELKIQELKEEVEAARLRLQEKRKEGGAADRDEKKEALRGLNEKYNKLREEYNTLLGEKSGEAKK